MPIIRRTAFLMIVVVTFGASSAVGALPLSRLNSISPAGVRAGAAVEVTLEGADLEGTNELLLSRTGINVEPLGGLKFRITAPADFAPGPIDVRAVGDWGVSNPRTFTIGTLEEIAETEPNNLISQAQKVAVGSVINGVIGARADVDYFSFPLEQGETIVIDGAAERIDSQLDGVLTLFGPNGQALEISNAYDRRDPRIDFTAPAAGEYKVRMHDLTYGGGSGSFYRLSIHRGPTVDQVYPPAVLASQQAELHVLGRLLPSSQPSSAVVAGKPLEEVAINVTAPSGDEALALATDVFLEPRQGGTDAFTVRSAGGTPLLVGIAKHPVIAETEPNDALSGPQTITPPTEITGRCDKPGDKDIYRFPARKDQPIEIQAISEQAGSPADLAFFVRRITGTDEKTGQVTVEDIGEFDDNPASAGGLSYVTSTHDPSFVFAPPVDGDYLLEVRDRFAESRGDARFIYRVRLAPAEPDFRLLLTPADPSNPSSLLIRAGGTLEASVLVFRQGGFAGPIDITVEGLPAGVTASPAPIGPGMSQSGIVFHATPEAAASNAIIKVTGTARIGDKDVRREARSATIIWPAGGNAPRPARLTRSIPLAVRGSAPYLLTAVASTTKIGQGALLDIQANLERRTPDFTDKLAGLTALNLPPNADNAVVEIPAGQNAATLPIYFKAEVIPGTYAVYLRGAGNVPFTKTPMDPAAKKDPVEVADPSLPILVTVVPRPLEIAPASAEPALKVGQNLPLAIKIQRVNGYTGPVRLSLHLPAGITGIDAPEITLPADIQETILPIQVASGVPVGDKGGVTIRGLARMGNDVIPVDARIVLKVAQ